MLRGSPTKGRNEMEIRERTFNPVGAGDFSVEVDPHGRWIRLIFEAGETRLIFQFPGSDFWDWLEDLSAQAGEDDD